MFLRELHKALGVERQVVPDQLVAQEGRVLEGTQCLLRYCGVVLMDVVKARHEHQIETVAAPQLNEILQNFLPDVSQLSHLIAVYD